MLKKEEPLWKKILWAGLFALLRFNLIGSASSGGYLGIGASLILAIIMLNKNLIKCLKPILILLGITIIIAGVSLDRWLPEITNAIDGVLGNNVAQESTEGTIDAPEAFHSLESILTIGNDVIIGVDGNEMIISLVSQDILDLKVTDKEGSPLKIVKDDTGPIYTFEEERFSPYSIQTGKSQRGYNYFTFSIENQEQEWTFWAMDGGAFYGNELGKLVKLEEVVTAYTSHTKIM